MEEYLQNMKCLRSQMNDFEDRAANVSVEEEKQKMEFQILEKDLHSVKAETMRLKEEADRMFKAKAQTQCQISEKRKKLVSLEIESATLSQTLELLQQENTSLFAKITDKSAYYAKSMESMDSILKEQQDWISSHNLTEEVKDQTNSHMAKQNSEMDFAEGKDGSLGIVSDEKSRDVVTKLDSAKDKAMSTINHLMCKLDNFPPELKQMDINALEEEHKALLSDKAGEKEYLQSLQERIEEIKGISVIVTCPCGEEYTV